MCCLCAESYQMPPVPGVGRHRVLSAEVGVQNCHHLPCSSEGQPFPLSPMGLLGSRSCPFIVGCQERASSLYSFKEWEGEGRKREICQNSSPCLSSLTQGW